jgi:NaMN:DMB phosphoribosyltransferase
VKPAALFLSGLSAIIAGAFIRSCQPVVPVELLSSLCGPAAHDAAGFHQHCAGCFTMLAGAAAMLAALMPALRKRRARAT